MNKEWCTEKTCAGGCQGHPATTITERLCNNDPSKPIYTIQPVVKLVVKLVWQLVECLYTRYSRLSNRLSNPFDNRFDNGFDNRLYRVYKYLPSWQQVVSCKWGFSIYADCWEITAV